MKDAAIIEDTQNTEEIECPFCAEVIKRKAVKCKYCGEFLDGRKTQPKKEVQPVIYRQNPLRPLNL